MFITTTAVKSFLSRTGRGAEISLSLYHENNQKIFTFFERNVQAVNTKMIGINLEAAIINTFDSHSELSAGSAVPLDFKSFKLSF